MSIANIMRNHNSDSVNLKKKYNPEPNNSKIPDAQRGLRGNGEKEEGRGNQGR